MKTSILTLTLLFSSTPDIPVVSAIEGSVHSTVQTLTEFNFDAALEDPANALWLLKFYAPWCGHCKRLAPVLDKVAPLLAGKMAIGKVDCTKEKALCRRFSVNSYPTLRVYRDGSYFDYPSTRDAVAIQEFAEKMSQFAVSGVNTHEEALRHARKGNGVAFVAYDSSAIGETVEEQINSSTTLQIFNQVARKQQAQATFCLIPSGASPETLKEFGVEGKSAFFAKVEENVDTEVFSASIELSGFISYVEENNLPLITDLGADNFRRTGNLGKILIVLTIDPSDKTTDALALQKEYRELALSANQEMKSKYIFCTMDALKWGRFLTQFGAGSGNTIFLLNVPRKVYWDQPDPPLQIKELIEAHLQGNLVPKKQGSGKVPLTEFYKHPRFFYVLFQVILGLFLLRLLWRYIRRRKGASAGSKSDEGETKSPQPAASKISETKKDD